MRTPKNTPAQKPPAGELKDEQIDRAWLVKAAMRLTDGAMADREYEIASEALETLARITGHWPSEGGPTIRIRSSAPLADEEWIDVEPARRKAIRKQ